MTLLVGFAPGKDDRSGIEFAATLARSVTPQEDLLIVSVVPAPWPTPVAGNTDREFVEWAAGRGQAAVTEAEAVLTEYCPAVTARAIWVQGRSIPTTLLEEAEKIGASTIVVGSGDDGAYGAIHLNSTSDRLLHSSTIPVAIATRGYTTRPTPLSRISCAFRGDEASKRTLTAAAELALKTGVPLRVITFAVRGRTMYPPEIGLKTEDAVLEKWVEQSKVAQAAAETQLRADGRAPIEIESVVAVGRSWMSTVDSVEWNRDEILVVGSSSTSVLERIFLGSSATKIVRYSPVPVIAVP